MFYIKQYCDLPYEISLIGIIFTKSYSKSVDHILALVRQAKRDYPYLVDKDIRIRVYAESNRGILGIEFPISKPVSGYQKIDDIELSLF